MATQLVATSTPFMASLKGRDSCERANHVGCHWPERSWCGAHVCSRDGAGRPAPSAVFPPLAGRERADRGGLPHRRVLARFYLAYNVLLRVFATSVFLSSERSRLFTVGWVLQVVNCVSGMLQVTAFRMDPIGAPQTRAGIAHVVCAGLSSLCSLVGAFVFGFAGRCGAFWRPLVPFSVASGIAIAVTGVPAAVSAATRSRVMGLFERCTIGLYLLWVLVLSTYALIRRPEAPAR
jgi:Protein of unknown function (DUF998)